MIRRFKDEDIPAFVAMRNCEAVARYQGWSVPFSDGEARAFVGQMATAHPDTVGEWFQFALEERQSGAFAGDIGVHALPDLEAEIGFSLHPDFQKRGLMTEALTAMFCYLFEQRGKRQILGAVDVLNMPSCRLLERSGFVRKDTVEDKANGWIEHIYVLTQDEWQDRS